jgi:hypothetical protein
MLIMADTADMCVMESKITSKAVPHPHPKKRKRVQKKKDAAINYCIYILYIPSLTEKGIVTTP